MMSDDGRTDAATSGGDGDDEAGAPGGARGTDAPGGARGTDAPGGARGTDAPGGARGTDAPDAGTEGTGGTYPAEKLDLGGGTSDGDTPVGHTGN